MGSSSLLPSVDLPMDVGDSTEAVSQEDIAIENIEPEPIEEEERDVLTSENNTVVESMDVDLLGVSQTSTATNLMKTSTEVSKGASSRVSVKTKPPNLHQDLLLSSDSEDDGEGNKETQEGNTKLENINSTPSATEADCSKKQVDAENEETKGNFLFIQLAKTRFALCAYFLNVDDIKVENFHTKYFLKHLFDFHKNI